jgi:hypothetical protein
LGKTAKAVRSAAEDVDGEGSQDLVLFFRVSDLVLNGALDASSTALVLPGATVAGMPIGGGDSVRIVP